MRTLWSTAFMAVGVIALLAGATAAAADPLPVPPTFFSGIGPELGNPGGDLPGVNEWDCRPGAAHPNPVILVHGTAGGAQTNWGPMAPRLKNEGYCVYALTYGSIPGSPWPVNQLGGLMRMDDSAAELSAFVDKVLAASGAKEVDFVGHSQGTLMPNYYVKELGGAEKVGRYVSLAPMWNGTGMELGGEVLGDSASVADALKPYAVGQMIDGPGFLAQMHAGGVYAPGVQYTNIMTRYDELVLPYTSGYVEGPNATNIVVQDECAQDFSDHLAIAASVRAQQYVLNALDPDHAQPVPCVFVPPIFG
ncbi:esterase/lipase family protein [Tomitella biformata]|uniref:esterase/lipase family protein n=1 Tax=Tomitella biformata TaxID=630403 RepID=UPI0004640090|nr:alpha/beta fold hydrolase [Tomitella biformata]